MQDMAAGNWFARGLITILFVAAGWNLEASAEEARRRSARKRSEFRDDESQGQTTALLLSLEEGVVGERVLGEWARHVEMSDYELPLIWVLVSSVHSSILAMLRDLSPTLQPFFPVDEDASWATVISEFQAMVCM